MSAKTLFPAIAMAGLLALPAGARADDVTPDQAKDLEGQLRGWMASLVAPAVNVGDHPIRVTPEDDHFKLELPAPAVLSTMGVTEPGLVVTMSAKPMDGGRWALENLHFPSPLRLKAPTERNAKAGPKAPNQAPKTWVGTFGTQEFHGVFDPSFATTSTFDMAWTDFRSTTSQSITSVGRTSGHTVWQPAADGHIDMTADSSAEKIQTEIVLPDGMKVSYSAERGHTTSHLRNFAPASLATLIRSVAALVPTMAGTKDSLSDAQKELARKVVYALRDLASGAEGNETIEGLRFQAAGHNGSLKSASAGGSIGAPDGKLALGMALTLDGLDSPDIPNGVFRDYLPRHISLKPRISGVPAEDVVKLMLKAIDTDSKDMPSLEGDAMALLAAGPLEVGLDEIQLDLGTAGLTGTASVDVSSPADITGVAKLTATGLDGLIRRSNTAPELKQIAPALIFLKGIGKQDGGETTWAVNYEDGKLTVNDTDLSSMLSK